MDRLKTIIELIAINWQTSVAGALIIILSTLASMLNWSVDAKELVAMIGAIVGIAFLLSRDANKTSEGTKVTPARIELGHEIDAARMVTTAHRVQLTPEKQQIAENELINIRKESE
jgi:hypothetical protein